METRVRFLRGVQGQDIHIPEAFVLPGHEAILRFEDGRITLEAVAKPSLLEVLSRLDRLDEEWPGIEDRPPEIVSL